MGEFGLMCFDLKSWFYKFHVYTKLLALLLCVHLAREITEGLACAKGPWRINTCWVVTGCTAGVGWGKWVERLWVVRVEDWEGGIGHKWVELGVGLDRLASLGWLAAWLAWVDPWVDPWVGIWERLACVEWWLERVRLPRDVTKRGRTKHTGDVSRLIEIGQVLVSRPRGWVRTTNHTTRHPVAHIPIREAAGCS